MQSVVESRKGGETGVAEVRFVEGDDFQKTAEAGLWSPKLADAAIAANPVFAGTSSLRELSDHPKFGKRKPHGILVTYRNGLKAFVIGGVGDATTWSFSAQVVGEDRPRATSFYVGPWENRNLFKALSHAIQAHFRGERTYPVERTLLVTGILETAMRSRRDKEALETPQLAIAYEPTDFRAYREMGDTWKILTPEIPQPPGLDTFGRSVS
ncbi:MAG: hypothetical protein ABS79_07005 [Planctomycetes bacterium SCN 63-9]|nr:MAG: hypothetical protein ABS79_07005 [Planctomycetes bacterium SCN 63-9]